MEQLNTAPLRGRTKLSRLLTANIRRPGWYEALCFFAIYRIP